MAGLLLFALSAHAGTYVWTGTDPKTGLPIQSPTISGTGAEAITSPTFTGNRPYVPAVASLGYMVGGYNLADAAAGSSGSASDTLSGTIVATFTWQADPKLPSDPAPTSVIVAQSCGINCAITGTGSGTIANGLGATASGPALSGCYSVQYVVRGGATFSVDCSPTMSASVSASASGAGGKIYVHIAYNATVYPVTVGPGGTMLVSGVQYGLTGQQITATLQGIPSGCTVTKYTWTQPSGTCFKTYNQNATSNQLVALGSADLTGPAVGSTTVSPLNFYDRAQENLTVTCTATMKAPDGKTVLNVSATSPQINMEKPTPVWTTNSDDPTLGPLFSQSGMGFAERWNAGITVPSPFSGGMGCFAQTTTPSMDFQRSPTGLQSINCYMEELYLNADGTSSYQMPKIGLDTNFPYQYSASQFYSQGYIWNASTSARSSGDAPSVMFAIPAADNGGNKWTSASATEAFTTWLMYMPPSSTTGSGATAWVPLQTVTWYWSGNVVKNQATGTWNSATNGSPPVTGYTSDSGTPTNTPPQWSCTNVAPTALYPLY
ncbi:MAG: hypothetical protein ACRYFS_05355 [Janthinobacterium lividum]